MQLLQPPTSENTSLPTFNPDNWQLFNDSVVFTSLQLVCRITIVLLVPATVPCTGVQLAPITTLQEQGLGNLKA
eukprot:1976597-Rhodomonas_salina.1